MKPSLSLVIVGVICTSSALAAPKGKAWIRYTQPAGSACKHSDPGKGTEIHGDFDGDKKMDTAVLQMNPKSKELRLLVTLKSNPSESMVVYTGPSTGDVAIRLISPGNQKTWCGKTGTCEPEKLQSIRIVNDSIGFEYCEKAEDLYYWDTGAKKFTSVVIGD